MQIEQEDNQIILFRQAGKDEFLQDGSFKRSGAAEKTAGCGRKPLRHADSGKGVAVDVASDVSCSVYHYDCNRTASMRSMTKKMGHLGNARPLWKVMRRFMWNPRRALSFPMWQARTRRRRF